VVVVGWYDKEGVSLMELLLIVVLVAADGSADALANDAEVIDGGN
jgi:hypothetical protein